MIVAALKRARRELRLRQRCAVVRLARVFRRDRHRLAVDAQRTDVLRDARVLRCIRQRVRVRIVLVVAVAVVLDACRRCGDRQRVACRQHEHLAALVRRDRLPVVRHRVHLVGVRCAVVRPALRRGRDRQSRRVVRDLQRTNALAQRVVALDRRAVPNQAVAVRYFAYVRDRSRYRERRRLRLTAFRRYESGDAARRRQRIAVIFLLAAFRYDRQRRRRDLLPAVGVDEGDHCEVRVLVLEVRIGKAHIGLAGIVAVLDHVRTGRGSGLAGHETEVGLLIQRRVDAVDLDAVDRVAGGRMTFAVVGRRAGVAVQGDRDVDRRDGQLAVFRRDVGVEVLIVDNVAERVVVLLIIADVSDAARGRRDRELVARREREDETVRAFVRRDRLRFRDVAVVVKHVIGDRVDVLLMGLSVVRPFLRCGRDLDRQVRRVDLQFAVDDVELDRVVSAVRRHERIVLEAALGKTHRIRARILLRDLCGDAACKTQREAVRLAVVRSAVRIVFDFADELVAVLGEPAVVFDNVAGDGLVLAVVIIFRLVAADVDGQRRLGDGQLARNVRDIIVVQIAADGRVACDDLARVFADVHFRTVQRDARQRVAALQTGYRDLVADRDRLTLLAEGDRLGGVGRVRFALRCAVVGVSLIDDRDGDLRLVDGELAVLRNRKRHVDARIVIAEVRRVQVHRVDAEVGLRDRCRTAIGDLALVEQVAGAGCVVALNRVRRTAVGLGLLMTGDRDRHRDLFDRQRTEVVGHNIVAGCGFAGLDRRVARLDNQRARIERTVVRRACLGAGGGGVVDRQRLAVDEPVDRVFGGRAGSCAFDVVAVLLAAVIGERARVDRDRELTLTDDQRAVVRRDIELRGDVVAVRVGDLIDAGDRVRGNADIGQRRVGRRKTADRVGLAVLGELERLDEARRGVRLTVVGIAAARCGQGVGVLIRTVGDLEGTFRLIDVVVVRVGVRLQRVGERVAALADQRLAARELVRCALAGDPAGLRYEAVVVLVFDVFVRQRGAVVFLLGVAARQGDVALFDLLITVGDAERDRCEVRVRVRELIFRKTHVGLSVGIAVLDHVRTRRGSRAAEREVVFNVIQRAACRRGVAGHAVHAAVVCLGILRADDRNGDVDRVDLDVTVGDAEFNVGEVRVCRGEHRIEETHIGLTVGVRALDHVGTGCARRAVEADLVLGEQRIADAYDTIAVNRMFVAVVIKRLMVTFDHNDNVFCRCDLLITVGDAERDRAEVGVVVRELTCVKVHVFNAVLPACCACRAGEREIALGIQRRIDAVDADALNVIAGDRMVISVIGQRTRMSLDRNRDIDRRDLLITVDDLERDREVAVRIGELALGKAHIGLAVRVAVLDHVRAARARRAGEADIGFKVQRIARGEGVARDRVRGAVVRIAVGLTGDGDGNRKRVDRQGAVGGGDGVVRKQRALVRRPGERVRAFADVGARAGDVVGQALAGNKAVAGNRDVRLRVLRQRLPVIGLAVICTRQRDLARGDRQSAGCLHVVVVRVGRLYIIGNRSDIRDARDRVAPVGAVQTVLVRRARGDACRAAALMVLTVILVGIIRRGDRKAGGRLIDRQGAGLIGYIIIGRISRCARGI